MRDEMRRRQRRNTRRKFLYHERGSSGKCIDQRIHTPQGKFVDQVLLGNQGLNYTRIEEEMTEAPESSELRLFQVKAR